MVRRESYHRDILPLQCHSHRPRISYRFGRYMPRICGSESVTAQTRGEYSSNLYVGKKVKCGDRYRWQVAADDAVLYGSLHRGSGVSHHISQRRKPARGAWIMHCRVICAVTSAMRSTNMLDHKEEWGNCRVHRQTNSENDEQNATNGQTNRQASNQIVRRTLECGTHGNKQTNKHLREQYRRRTTVKVRTKSVPTSFRTVLCGQNTAPAECSPYLEVEPAAQEHY